MQKKLTISPCTVQKNGKLKVDASKKFEALINPADYRQGKSISYNADKTIGQLGSDQKFNSINPETLKLSLVLDGTGVLEPSGSKKAPQDVESQFKKLNSIIYTFQGDKHEPNHVRILWGKLIFYGRLDSMSAENTLFSSQGKPIRAKVSLKFKAFISNREASLRANRSSPDLSHLVTFSAGDSLPLLCYKIYGDTSYYAKVARANNITNFRDIKIGTRLRFPPLR